MQVAVIIQDLRRRIVTGEYAPGAQIPLRQSLLKTYGASMCTVQRAVNHLLEEGFLEGHGSKGMFVPACPPHRFQIGITFPVVKSDRNVPWDSHWQALEQAAAAFHAADPRYTFKIYYGMGINQDEETKRQLLDDLHGDRLAGLLVLEYARIFNLLRQELPKIPVVIFVEAEAATPAKPRPVEISHDYVQMFSMAVDHLRSRGRKRIAVVTNTELPTDRLPKFRKILREAGVVTRPEWMQGVCLCQESIPWTANVVKGLFSPNLKDKPDSLIILNENLTATATRALAELDLIPGQDIDVVSHSNFPTAGTPLKGVSRVGFDAHEGLATAIRLISRARQGQPVPGRSTLGAVWEQQTRKGGVVKTTRAQSFS
ncbi:MAG: GntR family transcriptional regulator [Lentisphaeria bacterium]